MSVGNGTSSPQSRASDSFPLALFHISRSCYFEGQHDAQCDPNVGQGVVLTLMPHSRT